MLKEIKLGFESIYQGQQASRADTATLGEACEDGCVECFDPGEPCVDCFEPSAVPATGGQKADLRTE